MRHWSEKQPDEYGYSWKDWKGQWQHSPKRYKTKAAAKAASKKIAQTKAENGHIHIFIWP